MALIQYVQLSGVPRKNLHFQFVFIILGCLLALRPSNTEIWLVPQGHRQNTEFLLRGFTSNSDTGAEILNCTCINDAGQLLSALLK